MKNVLSTLEKIWVFFSSIFRTKYIANKCGHTTKSKGFMKYGDHTTTMTMPLAENGKPDYCIQCISNMSIRCAWCGGPIAISSPITLYIPNDSFEVPDYAVTYSGGESIALVGCLRWNCADGGFDRAGFWLTGEGGKGCVQRVPTVIETLLANPHASMIIVQDTHDITEAVNPRVF